MSAPVTRRPLGSRTAAGSRSALLLAAGFLLAAAGAAFAFWTITVLTDPTSYAAADADALSSPIDPTATVDGSGAITIGWDMPATQLTGAQHQVTRTSGPGSPVTVCTVASAATSCQDTGLTAGTTYDYSVTAVLHSWSSPAITTSATTATPTLSISLSASSAAAGSPLTVQSIQAKVGATVDSTYTGSKTLTWSGLAPSPSGQAPTYPSSSVTFAGGMASPGTTVTARAAGSNTLTATDSGATAVTGSVTFTVLAAAAENLAFTPATPGPGTPGSPIPEVAVAVRDAFGNLVSSQNTGSITMTIKPGSPQASFTSGTTTVIPVNGVAAFTNLVVNAAGTYTLTAAPSAISGVTTAVDSGSFSVTSSTATKFAFTSVAPSGPASSEATLGPITVQQQDSFGNAVIAGPGGTGINLASSSTGTKVFSLSSGGTAVTSVTIPEGASSVSFFYGDTKAGSATITASGGLTSASQTATIVAAVAAKFAFTSAAVSGTASSTANLGPITVQQQDTFGNPTTAGPGGTAVNLTSDSSGTKVFSLTSGGATVSTVTMAPGTSSISFFYGDTKAGNPTISAAGGLVGATQTATVTAAAANKFAFTSAPVSGAASSSATLGPIAVQRQDIFGNAVTAGTTVVVNLVSNSTGTSRFALSSGGASVTSATIAAGSTSTSFFYGDTKAGTPTITATGPLISATQQQTVSAGAASALCFVTTGTTCISGTQVVGNGGTFTARVQLIDSFANPVQAASAITITVSSSGNLQAPSPATLTIAAGASQSGQVSASLPNGNRSGVLTASTATPGIADATAAIED
jgi:hypothetical protein